jgi:hypothetical protein
MRKRSGVTPAFSLGLLRAETGFEPNDISLKVDQALRGDPAFHSHLQCVSQRDHSASVLETNDTEISGSVVDEWSRVGRIRSRLLTLCSHFERSDFIFSTVLGPVIPASGLDGSAPVPPELTQLLQSFRSEVVRRIERSPLVEVALVGWLELEETKDLTSYVRSWWRRRGSMIWGTTRPPKNTYVLHAHFAGVVLTTAGGCAAETFSTMLTPAFPWSRAVNTEQWRTNKTKETSAKDISRYAWKLGNREILKPRPFPSAAEIAARARFWSAVGNPNRDFEVRISRSLRCSRRTWSGRTRGPLDPQDRIVLSTLWPAQS